MDANARAIKTLSFPLGDWLKSEVRGIAKENGLATAEKKKAKEFALSASSIWKIF